MPRASSQVLTFLVIISGLLALLPASDAASVGLETSRIPMLPPLADPALKAGLVGASAAYVEDQLFILGGRRPDGAYSENILRMDPVTKEVTKVASLPQSVGGDAQGSRGRYSATAATVNGKIYYFGGAQLVEADINGDGVKEKVPKSSRDVVIFDPATSTARLLNDKLPLGAWGMSSVVFGSKVYLFGGFTFDLTDLPNTGRHTWVLRFDTALGEPSTPSGARFRDLDSKLAYAVQDSAAALVGRRILIMGGLSDHDNNTNPCPTYSYYDSTTGKEDTRQIEVCLTKRMMSFDPENEVVLGIAGELPYRAQFISAATVAGKAYVSGALLSDGSSSSSIIEVSMDRVGSPQTRVLLPSLPRGTFGQAVATDGKTIALVGGRYGAEKELSDEIVRLDPRITPPWAPRSATAVDITGGVRLSWEAPTYNGDSAITGYRVYRSEPGVDETRLTETTSLTFEDKSTRPGAEYSWRVVAVNQAGESVTSGRVSRASGTTAPGAVSSFEAFPGNDQVLLRWRAPAETGGSNLTGYRILRNDQILTSLPPDANSYSDNTAKNGETYVYYVRASNVKGDGTPSEAARVTPAFVPSPPSNLNAEVITAGTGSAVRVSWFASDTVDHYVVYRSARSGTLGTPLANVTSTSYVDNVVERGQTYFYSVVGANNVGRSPPSGESAVSLVSKPDPPTQVLAFGQEGEIRVSWAPPENTGEAPAGLLRYAVSRSTSGGAPRIVKTDIETTLFVDRFVTPGVTYAYTVATLNPMASDASDPAIGSARVVVNKPPIAILAANPSVADLGVPVELDASQSGDPDGNIRSYRFDFGDRTDLVTTQVATVSHQYTVNGTYNATVVVTDDRGETTLAYTQVVIGEVVTDKIPDAGIGGSKATPATGAPGSKSPGIPGPSAGLLVAGLVVVAVALRRRARA